MTFFLALLTFSFLQADLDRDSIPDELEQTLLERFAPTFIVSAEDCDVLPAEFAAGSVEPRVVARNGAIYGQVFKNGSNTEIHYYHLWSRDCGLTRHDLDIEHVSVLLSPDHRALYWYAASHEDTVCDSSSGARAALLGYEFSGPSIWISHGKHASFLSLEKCHLGCGVDQCKKMKVMPTRKPINVGERTAPLNGAVWVNSPRWPFRMKMQRDFNDSVIAQLAEREETGITAVNDSISPVKAIILGADTGLDGAITGNRHGLNGAATGLKHAGMGFFKALRAVARVLNPR